MCHWNIASNYVNEPQLNSTFTFRPKQRLRNHRSKASHATPNSHPCRRLRAAANDQQLPKAETRPSRRRVVGGKTAPTAMARSTVFIAWAVAKECTSRMRAHRKTFRTHRPKRREGQGERKSSSIKTRTERMRRRRRRQVECQEQLNRVWDDRWTVLLREVRTIGVEWR